jgi:hypothetical protein
MNKALKDVSRELEVVADMLEFGKLDCPLIELSFKLRSMIDILEENLEIKCDHCAYLEAELEAEFTRCSYLEGKLEKADTRIHTLRQQVHRALTLAGV